MITGGFDKIEGCMYYRDNVVPATCIQNMTDGRKKYLFSELSRCVERHMDENALKGSADAPFIAESGEEAQLKSCFFEGKSRRYYRYEEAVEDQGAMLYLRALSCDGGCREEKSLYLLEMSPDGIAPKKLR
jgi:hypothetical protein